MKKLAIVLSTEHAEKKIPKAYEHLFADLGEDRNSHLAYDIGAKEIASYLSKTLAIECHYASVSRLIVDCNRSLNNPQVFSKYTAKLTKDEKNKIINKFYLPYREEVEKIIASKIAKGKQVLHLSIHTFTEKLNGKLRNAAISLLYDPQRHGEKEVARIWHELLLHEKPAYRIRTNYPYKGTSDGFTTHLRKKYPEADYLGIEVESNQALVKDKYTFKDLQFALSDSLISLLRIL